MWCCSAHTFSSGIIEIRQSKRAKRAPFLPTFSSDLLVSPKPEGIWRLQAAAGQWALEITIGRAIKLTLGQICSPNLCQWGSVEISSHEFNLKWLWVVELLGTWLRKPPSPLVPENSANNSLRAAGSTQSELTNPQGAEASRGGRDSRGRPSRPRRHHCQAWVIKQSHYYMHRNERQDKLRNICKEWQTIKSDIANFKENKLKFEKWTHCNWKNLLFQKKLPSM